VRPATLKAVNPPPLLTAPAPVDGRDDALLTALVHATTQVRVVCVPGPVHAGAGAHPPDLAACVHKCEDSTLMQD
jgi:hypothetical protein